MFDQLVLAGGGGRCAWQVGFLDAVSAELKLAPRTITTVSASSMMACLMFAQRTEVALTYFDKAMTANRKNAYWGNLFRKERIFPQYEIYRRALLELLDGQLGRLAKAPDIRIAITRSPRWLGSRSALVVGAAAYLYDQRGGKRIHPVSAVRLGFRNEWVRAQDCNTVEELTALILHSSCTPPLTPLMSRDGFGVLDGGIVDNIPIGGLDEREGTVLILLTRQYPERPLMFHGGTVDQPRLYVQPSQRPPVDSWDYTRPDLIRRTYDLGRTDGEHFLLTTRKGFTPQPLSLR